MNHRSASGREQRPERAVGPRAVAEGRRTTLLATPAVLVERLDLPAIPTECAFDHSPMAQVMFTLRGSFIFEGAGTSTLIDCNQIALLQAGLVSRDRGVNGDPVSVLICTPNAAVTENAWGCDSARLVCLSAFGRLCTRQTIAGLKLCHWLASHPWDSLVAEDCALRLLDIAAATTAASREHSRDSDREWGPPSRRARELTAHVKLLLAARCDLTSVSALAREVGVNPVYLTQVFRRHEHVSISGYRSRLRLSRALFSLRDADDLSRLALDLGYASHSHFTSAFRRAFGETPSRCRATLRGDPASGRDPEPEMARSSFGARR